MTTTASRSRRFGLSEREKNQVGGKVAAETAAEWAHKWRQFQAEKAAFLSEDAEDRDHHQYARFDDRERDLCREFIVQVAITEPAELRLAAKAIVSAARQVYDPLNTPVEAAP